jgi:fatty acid-binding protein DegV
LAEGSGAGSSTERTTTVPDWLENHPQNVTLLVSVIGFLGLLAVALISRRRDRTEHSDVITLVRKIDARQQKMSNIIERLDERTEGTDQRLAVLHDDNERTHDDLRETFTDHLRDHMRMAEWDGTERRETP